MLERRSLDGFGANEAFPPPTCRRRSVHFASCHDSISIAREGRRILYQQANLSRVPQSLALLLSPGHLYGWSQNHADIIQDDTETARARNGP